jgi:hypothetical protein
VAFSRPHQRYCGTGIWSGRDKPTDWRAMESPARLCRPGRQASLAHPRGKPGFSTLSSGCGRETDCPQEGGGFELPVPDERGYGLAFVCRVMGLLFGAQLLGFEGAKRPDSLAGRPGSRAFFGGRLTKRQANPRRRQVRKASMGAGSVYGFGGWRLALLLERLRASPIYALGGQR